jgi:heme/copper-type cytochrome/quinol oxidase subunit 2
MLHDAEWVNIVDEKDVPYERLVDSKLALKIAAGSIVSLIFMPAAFASWRLAVSAEKTEGKNKYNQVAKILSIVGMCLVIGVMVALSFITLNILGLSLL